MKTKNRRKMRDTLSGRCNGLLGEQKETCRTESQPDQKESVGPCVHKNKRHEETFHPLMNHTHLGCLTTPGSGRTHPSRKIYMLSSRDRASRPLDLSPVRQSVIKLRPSGRLDSCKYKNPTLSPTENKNYALSPI